MKRALQNLTSSERQELIEQIDLAIEPFDIAGLGNRSRRNWYPVDACDLLGAAGKLGTEQEAIKKLLVRSGFFSTSD